MRHPVPQFVLMMSGPTTRFVVFAIGLAWIDIPAARASE